MNRQRFPNIENLAAEVLVVADHLRSLAGDDAHLEIDCLPCAGEIQIDSEELMRVLFNLLTNSLIALRQSSTPPSLRQIRITVGPAAKEESMFRHKYSGLGSLSVVLTVWDNGSPMTHGDLLSRFLGGVSIRGRCLKKIQKILSRAGGRLYIYSSSSHGTRVKSEFPVGLVGTRWASAYPYSLIVSVVKLAIGAWRLASPGGAELADF